MTTLASRELVLLERLIEPKQGGLSASAARAILKIDFGDDDKARMRTLSRKAQEGALSEDEELDMEAYDRLGHLLALLHAKSRHALAHKGQPAY